jgi:hypothetical protein
MIYVHEEERNHKGFGKVFIPDFETSNRANVHVRLEWTLVKATERISDPAKAGTWFYGEINPCFYEIDDA